MLAAHEDVVVDASLDVDDVLDVDVEVEVDVDVDDVEVLEVDVELVDELLSEMVSAEAMPMSAS